MKEGVYEFKLIAYPSKAPLPEVKHKGETYVVSTPGQEYQAVVQLPSRGGANRGYRLEMDIDGKPRVQQGRREREIYVSGVRHRYELPGVGRLQI